MYDDTYVNACWQGHESCHICTQWWPHACNHVIIIMACSHPAWLFVRVDLLDMASQRTQDRLARDAQQYANVRYCCDCS